MACQKLGTPTQFERSTLETVCLGGLSSRSRFIGGGAQLVLGEMLPSCYLFVPADQPTMLEKAPGRGAGALIIDAEDAVAASERPAALAMAARWIREADTTEVERWVRIPNEAPTVEIAAIVSPGLTGVVIPKVRRDVDVVEAVAALRQTAGGQPARVIALIETAQGLQNVERIASIPGVDRLMSGEVDMAAELGIAPDEESAWWPVRSRIVVASAAAGLAGPIGPVSPDISVDSGLEDVARRLRRHGFRAGAAIHPHQIGPYSRAFAPEADDLAAARRIVERFEAALGEGRGVIVDDDGRMVDEAMVKSARRLLDEV